MKKIFTIFFVTLGVIFCILIIAGTYFFVADPYHIRPLISIMMEKSPATNTEVSKTAGTNNTTHATGTAATGTTTTNTTTNNPLLNASQEKALEAMGINPANLPTKITPEMETCFDTKLGTVRTTEIKNGATPTATDFFKARACLGQ